MSDTAAAPRMQIVQKLRQLIDQGHMSPGAQIPPERELSKQFNVQRPTIRNALKILESEGLVKQVSPRTRIVAERPRPMAHSIVVVSEAFRAADIATKEQPGWVFTITDAVHRAVAVAGLNLLVIHPERVTEPELQRVISGRPDGLIMPEFSINVQVKTQWLYGLKESGIPVVLYGNKPNMQDFDRVISDHHAGAYELTRAMIEAGRKRILMLYTAAADMYWVKARRSGYEQAMVEAHLEPLPMVNVPSLALNESDVDTEEGFDAECRHQASYLMDYLGPLARHKPVDAILAATDGDTYAIAAACRKLGATPGEDILITGYDNYWAECWERHFEASTPWATMDKHNPIAGQMLMDLLADRMAGKLNSEPCVRVLCPQILMLNQK